MSQDVTALQQDPISKEKKKKKKRKENVEWQISVLSPHHRLCFHLDVGRVMSKLVLTSVRATPQCPLTVGWRQTAQRPFCVPKLQRHSLKKTSFISCLYFYFQYKVTEGDSGNEGSWMSNNFPIWRWGLIKAQSAPSGQISQGEVQASEAACRCCL